MYIRFCCQYKFCNRIATPVVAKKQHVHSFLNFSKIKLSKSCKINKNEKKKEGGRNKK